MPLKQIAALEAAGLLHPKPPEMPPTGLTEEEAIIIIQVTTVKSQKS